MVLDHIGIGVDDYEKAEAFFAAALAAGGRDNGAPGLRLHCQPNGHNIEAVCLKPE